MAKAKKTAAKLTEYRVEVEISIPFTVFVNAKSEEEAKKVAQSQYFDHFGFDTGKTNLDVDCSLEVEFLEVSEEITAED